MENITEKLVDIEEAAQWFGVSPMTIRRWVADGMPSVRPSPKVLRFELSACTEWARNRCAV